MRNKLKNMSLAALGAAVLCVLAPLSLPVGTLPITLSFFALLLVAGILSPKAAIPAVLVYIALGAVGVPVFSNFSGGFQVIAGPTGGFIVGYLPMAIIVSIFKGNLPKTVIIMALSAILGYLMGCLWMSFTTESTFLASLLYTAATCAVPDTIKIIAAALLSCTIRKRLAVARARQAGKP